ncbi:MAG: TolC family protein, partial [Terriglobales bacterium]
MQLPGLKFAAGFFCSLTLATAFVSGAWAQGNQSTSVPQAPSASQPPATAQPKPFVVGEYSKARSHFPNPIAPYIGVNLPSPNLTNTPRLDQLLQNGKLMLSMNDAIALTLENNLDIAISRFNLNIADTDVL